MKKNVTILTLLNGLLMLSNLAIQALTVAYLGLGIERDSLFVAMSIPLYVNTLMAASFGSVVTPAVLTRDSVFEQRAIASRILIGLVCTVSLLVTIAYFFRGQLVYGMVPGFTPNEQNATCSLLGVSLLTIPLQAATCILSGYWIARDRVIMPSMAVFVGNLLIIAFIVWRGVSLSVTWVAWGYLAGAAVTLCIQLWLYLFERSARNSPEASVTSSVAKVFRQAFPLAASTIIGRSTPLIERNLASSMSAGTISCLGYSNYLVTFLVNATTSPIATAYYTRMCRHWRDGKVDELESFLSKGFVIVLSGALIVGGGIALSIRDLLLVLRPLTKLNAGNIDSLAIFCQWMMIAYICLALGSFTARIFYAAGQFVLAAVLDCIAVAFYIFTAVPLGRMVGPYGLLVAACLNAAFLAGLIIVVVKRKIRISFFLKAVIRLKLVLIAWGGSFFAAWLLKLMLAAPARDFAGLWCLLLYLLGVIPTIRLVARCAGGDVEKAEAAAA